MKFLSDHAGHALFPRTLIVRIFFLLALLLIISNSLWFFSYRYLSAEPKAAEIARFATSTVNLIRAALYAAAPEKRIILLAELSRREGIFIHPAEADDEITPLSDDNFSHYLQNEFKKSLGNKTQLAFSVDGIQGFWVSFRLSETDDDEYWLAMPHDRAFANPVQHWLIWAFFASLIALVVAWLFARRITEPLKELAHAAHTLGRGEKPAQITPSGAEEIQELARAFNRMADDLRRHNEERALVLAGISHDLRTPLTRLRLEAEMSLPDKNAQQAVIADIAQMESVISQFMDYARADTGETLQYLALEPLLSEVIAREAARDRLLHLEISSLSALWIRPKALSRALYNLIDNAWKYGQNEEGEAWVGLKAHATKTTLHIDIIDKGCGISLADVDRLKRPFARLENARTNATGTGLGLAIVERVARLHNGRLDLLENEGGGLIARLVLSI